MNYQPQFVSKDVKVEIRILFPKKILCYCRYCRCPYKKAKYAVLAIIKNALYPGCPWFYNMSNYKMPAKGEIKWATSFAYIGLNKDNDDYCKREETCEHLNETSDPVFTVLKKAEKMKRAILNSEKFKGKGELSIPNVSTHQICWTKNWPKPDKFGTLRIH